MKPPVTPGYPFLFRKLPQACVHSILITPNDRDIHFVSISLNPMKLHHLCTREDSALAMPRGDRTKWRECKSIPVLLDVHAWLEPYR